MKAIVLHPANIDINLLLGDISAIKAMYASRAMTTHGIIENTEEEDVEQFLEWCFDYTNTNAAYQDMHKCRGMNVADVLIVLDHGAYACVGVGWEKIE